MRRVRGAGRNDATLFVAAWRQDAAMQQDLESHSTHDAANDDAARRCGTRRGRDPSLTGGGLAPPARPPARKERPFKHHRRRLSHRRRPGDRSCERASVVPMRARVEAVGCGGTEQCGKVSRAAREALRGRAGRALRRSYYIILYYSGNPYPYSGNPIPLFRKPHTLQPPNGKARKGCE